MTPAQREFLATLDRDGHLTPEEVVEAARPIESPIHDLFSWNDAEAAHKYRIAQARTVIRRVKVEYVTSVIEVRSPVYIRDPEVAAREQGYVRLKLLQTREEAAMQALETELKQIVGRIERGRLVARGLNLIELFEDRLREIVTPVVPEEVDLDTIEAG